MAIQFSCNSCDNKLQVRDELAGRKVKCPKCGKVLAAPKGKEEAVATGPNPKRAAHPATVENEDQLRLKKKANDNDNAVDESSRHSKIFRRPRNNDSDKDEDRLGRRKEKNKTLLLGLLTGALLLCGGAVVLILLMTRAHDGDKKNEDDKKNVKRVEAKLATALIVQPRGSAICFNAEGVWITNDHLIPGKTDHPVELTLYPNSSCIAGEGNWHISKWNSIRTPGVSGDRSLTRRESSSVF